MTIFNRWGDKILKPLIRISTGTESATMTEESPDGVYFYVCKVNEIRLAGAVEQRVFEGIIHLTRGPVSK
ncbi:MAG: hypothetical protein IPP46_19240 [Bacteroidetes bacterium]|nr:hypothetical protein [Bacteroidota bacterium]